MQAFEFNADIKDNIIKLPIEYQGKLRNKVKVIILQNEVDDPSFSNENNSNLSNFLSFAEKNSIELPPDYKFDREEIIERS
jgi:hypothetical protein